MKNLPRLVHDIVEEALQEAPDAFQAPELRRPWLLRCYCLQAMHEPKAANRIGKTEILGYVINIYNDNVFFKNHHVISNGQLYSNSPQPPRRDLKPRLRAVILEALQTPGTATCFWSVKMGGMLDAFVAESQWWNEDSSSIVAF